MKDSERVAMIRELMDRYQNSEQAPDDMLYFIEDVETALADTIVVDLS